MVRTQRIQSAFIGLCLGLVVLVSGVVSARAPFSQFVVFGTSLSDPGNAFALIGLTSHPPYDSLDGFLVPSAPYAKGGHHFSNGPTWIEQVARPLGLGRSTNPAFGSASMHAANYAVGAARAREDTINFNLGTQVGAYLADTGGVAPASALYVIEIGSNDVRDALIVYALDGDGGPILAGALTATGASIQTLYQAGARTFLVWNVPDIGLTPAVRALDALVPGASGFATTLAASYNANLAATLATLQAVLPGLEIRTLDSFQLMNDIVAAPGWYGLETVDAPCLTPGVPPYTCSGPDEYLFWDSVHPTRAGHALIAEHAAALVH